MPGERNTSRPRPIPTFASFANTFLLCVLNRVTIFLQRKRRTGSLRVIKSADVQFFAQKQVQSKKRSSRPQALVWTEISQKFLWKHDLTCFYCA